MLSHLLNNNHKINLHEMNLIYPAFKVNKGNIKVFKL